MDFFEGPLTINQVLGKLGERFATTILAETGYKVCRADEIHEVGHSLLIRGSLNEFDCGNLHTLAQLCAELLVCEVRNRSCKNPRSVFYSFNPKPDLIDYPNTGNRRFRHYCAYQMSYLVILDKCSAVCSHKVCPIKSYLMIDSYIRNLWNCWSPSRFRNTWGQHTDGHPGRIDLFAFKNGKHYCLEVKVNTSRLSIWQILRLNWMKEQGFESCVFRVLLNVRDKEQLVDLYNQSKIVEAFEIVDAKYEIEEFSLSKHKSGRKLPKHKSVQELIPSVKEVEFLNRKAYQKFHSPTLR